MIAGKMWTSISQSLMVMIIFGMLESQWASLTRNSRCMDPKLGQSSGRSRSAPVFLRLSSRRFQTEPAPGLRRGFTDHGADHEGGPTVFLLSGSGAPTIINRLIRSRRIQEACSGEMPMAGFMLTEDGESQFVARLDGQQQSEFARGQSTNLIKLEEVVLPELRSSSDVLMISKLCRAALLSAEVAKSLYERLERSDRGGVVVIEGTPDCFQDHPALPSALSVADSNISSKDWLPRTSRVILVEASQNLDDLRCTAKQLVHDILDALRRSNAGRGGRQRRSSSQKVSDREMALKGYDTIDGTLEMQTNGTLLHHDLVSARCGQVSKRSSLAVAEDSMSAKDCEVDTWVSKLRRKNDKKFRDFLQRRACKTRMLAHGKMIGVVRDTSEEVDAIRSEWSSLSSVEKQDFAIDRDLEMDQSSGASQSIGSAHSA